VPAYQDGVVVLGVNGPDAGKAFVCSEHYFAARFTAVPDREKAPEEQAEQPAAAVAVPEDRGAAGSRAPDPPTGV
jgi:hypothetical protein